MRGLPQIDWASWKTRGGISIVAILLVLSPMIWCSAIPYTPPMGQGSVAISEDTFVSSVDETDHSNDVIIRIGNISDNGDEIVEIAFFDFELIPPPAGSYLADLVLEFHCAEVLLPGTLRIHRCESSSIESNVTFDNLPVISSTPFASITITHNGTHTISLHEEGGYTDWAIHPSLFAIIAERDTQLTIHSSEGVLAFQPKITFYTPPGLVVYPSENPFLCYLFPLSWVPVFIAVASLSVMCIKSSKGKNGAQGEI